MVTSTSGVASRGSDLSVGSNPPVNIQTPGPNVPPKYAAFSGKWIGIWDDNPSYTTSLVIESVTADGQVQGAYFYTTEKSKFVGQIADDAFTFGRAIRFTFKMNPDGQIAGVRNDSGLINTTLLHRI